MWRIIFLLFWALPAFAQLDKDTFYTLLESGNSGQLIQRIKSECIDFRLSEGELQQIGEQSRITLAIFNCLYDRAFPTGPGSKPTVSVPVESVPTVKTEVTSPSLDTMEVIHTRKIIELIHSLEVADRLENRDDRIKAQVENKSFLLNILKSKTSNITLDLFKNQVDKGLVLPGWVSDAVTKAGHAKSSFFPTLKLRASKSAEFIASTNERGLRLFVGLYMVNGTPEPMGTLDLDDHILNTHSNYPITYNPHEDLFELHELETSRRQTKIMLWKYFNKQEPLELFPGQWVFRIAVYNQAGGVQNNSYKYIEVEAGKHYTMNISWKNVRAGVRTLNFEIAEDS